MGSKQSEEQAQAERNRLIEIAGLLGIKPPEGETLEDMRIDVLHEMVTSFAKARNAADAMKAQREYVESNHPLALRRVIVRNNNQHIKEDGMIRTVFNAQHRLRRYIPFNVPWHIEYMLLKELESAHHFTLEDVMQKAPDGRDIPSEPREIQVKSFHIENLPPLTDEELEELAVAQNAQGRIRRPAAQSAGPMLGT